MKTKLVNDALIMAIWKRKPAKGFLWHTDTEAVNTPLIAIENYLNNTAFRKA
jgi:hypothetical protein